MDSVNRFALIVRPKRHFLEWANSLDDGPRLTVERLAELTDVYLVEAEEMAPDRKLLIDSYADEMWEQQLESWSLDEATWPKNRTPHTFRDWFDVTVVESVFDADPEMPWSTDPFDEPDDLEIAMTSCAWCGAQIDDEQEVISLFMTLRPEDPLKNQDHQVIAVPVAGEDRRAVVAQPGSEMAREGRDLSFMMCSETCAKSMKEALERERGAQMS